MASSSVESNVQLGQRTVSTKSSIADNALNFPPAGRKDELRRWLTEEGRFAPDTGRLLEILCDKLAALGVPIARATAHVRTLHPEFRGAARIWRRGENIEIRTTRHGIEFTSDYQNSPIQHIIETGQWLDTMLSETTDRHFPILATLRAQGITHYVMAPLVFSNRIVNAMSWATDAPGGFAEADVELFRDLVTAFVSVLEATAGRRIYGELLATYVGRDPGARIMAGAVQRGEVHHLKAAMLLADLRGFSRLTDELPEEQIVELLNAFFDLVVPGVVAGGGDVLKYVGDAVIAIFPVEGDDPAPACESALAARSSTGGTPERTTGDSAAYFHRYRSALRRCRLRQYWLWQSSRFHRCRAGRQHPQSAGTPLQGCWPATAHDRCIRRRSCRTGL